MQILSEEVWGVEERCKKSHYSGCFAEITATGIKAGSIGICSATECLSELSTLQRREDGAFIHQFSFVLVEGDPREQYLPFTFRLLLHVDQVNSIA